MRDHALREQAGKRLARWQVQLAHIAHRPRKEARIEKVQHGMLDPADILVHGQPVGPLGRVLRACKARIIPGAVDESVERVGLAPRGLSAFRTVHMFPARVPVQRIARNIEGHVLRQAHRKIRLRNRHNTAIRTVNDRNRTAPIALTRNAPVAQAVIHRAATLTCGLNLLDCSALRVVDRKSVEEA